MTQTTRNQPEYTLTAPTTAKGMTTQQQALVLGGTGKVGRRVAALLTSRGVPVRIGTRTATPAFRTISPEDFSAGLAAAGLVPDEVSLVSYLFSSVLDGRNSSLTNGVEQALGRPPRDFADYARETARTGVWSSR